MPQAPKKRTTVYYCAQVHLLNMKTIQFRKEYDSKQNSQHLPVQTRKISNKVNYKDLRGKVKASSISGVDFFTSVFRLGLYVFSFDALMG